MITTPVSNASFNCSMGGHGALVCFLKNPGLYKSVSAFAPICNPTECPWGTKAFTGYLGDQNKDAWKASYKCTKYLQFLKHLCVVVLKNWTTRY